MQREHEPVRPVQLHTGGHYSVMRNYILEAITASCTTTYRRSLQRHVQLHTGGHYSINMYVGKRQAQNHRPWNSPHSEQTKRYQRTVIRVWLAFCSTAHDVYGQFERAQFLYMYSWYSCKLKPVPCGVN